MEHTGDSKEAAKHMKLMKRKSPGDKSKMGAVPKMHDVMHYK